MPTTHPIRTDIEAGSVYYYNDPRLRSAYPHFCIVVNINPSEDTVILLVHASHRVNKVKERRKDCPQETLVEITPIQYSGFDRNSIIDCNEVLEADKEMLANKLGQRKLEIEPLLGLRFAKMLRKGIIASNQVAQRIKDLVAE